MPCSSHCCTYCLDELSNCFEANAIPPTPFFAFFFARFIYCVSTYASCVSFHFLVIVLNLVGSFSIGIVNTAFFRGSNASLFFFILFFVVVFFVGNVSNGTYYLLCGVNISCFFTSRCPCCVPNRLFGNSELLCIALCTTAVAALWFS